MRFSRSLRRSSALSQWAVAAAAVMNRATALAICICKAMGKTSTVKRNQRNRQAREFGDRDEGGSGPKS